ncbi:site-specific integrase [Actinomadura rayongensis]|uniref:Tyrosine-type recombinase/integrase n=1 Tax=Actinomadura rayongensis TaxID=1429076 RepID=A0A6I4WDD9_9ACTN|nr:site-specific integrase [Actinomadura rayongensis]MXQ65024.1 tyrosine-type recombinase/integrase [Actinomadura rayongensis]
MTKRRSRGDGGLHWDESRQRWIASVTVGYTPAGKRIVRKASDPKKSEALRKLKEKVRDYEDGLAIAPHNYTVAEAVEYWFALMAKKGRAGGTIKKNRSLIDNHVIPAVGARKLRELSVEDVEKWLESKTEVLGSDALKQLHSILNQSVKKAMARDKVKRNVVELAEIPEGRDGRPSKAMNLDQAEAVLKAAVGSSLEAYIVLSILIGARPEELRPLTWDHVDLDGRPAARGMPMEPPSINVWRSVRAKGETKTKKSRRTLAMPMRCVEALRSLKARQMAAAKKEGEEWSDTRLVFCTRNGTQRNVTNVLRDVRVVYRKAGLNPAEWTVRELRHTFVSLLSNEARVPIEHISRLVGHDGTAVTEAVYRKQLRPVLEEGATAMDLIFPGDDRAA